MEVKQRFKKALFAFFKDEILKEVGYNRGPVFKVIENTRPNIVTLSAAIDLIEDRQQFGMPAHVIYEESLNKAKRKLFEEIVQHMSVDTNSVMDERVYNLRRIIVRIDILKKR